MELPDLDYSIVTKVARYSRGPHCVTIVPVTLDSRRCCVCWEFISVEAPTFLGRQRVKTSTELYNSRLQKVKISLEPQIIAYSKG